MAKKVGNSEAKKIITHVYNKVKSHYVKKVHAARKIRKMKKKAASVKAAVKAALKGKKAKAAKVVKKAKKLLLVQEQAKSTQISL